MKILGLEIDNLSREDILKRLSDFLTSPGFHRIATINPEFLLLAEKDAAFRQALHEADLRIADGFGITLASFFLGESIHCRFPGADLMEEILRTAEKKSLLVFLIVRKEGLSSYQEVHRAMLKKYPALKIEGADYDMSSHTSYLIPHTTSVIFCNFGIPGQEIMLAEIKKLEQYSGIRIAMGVGGSFDFLTGKLPRAPLIMRMFGLEWLWRLFLQPKRWKRAWIAVFVFPSKVFLSKKKSPGTSS